MKAAAILLALGACADPVIELSMKVPTSMPASFDMSCITAVEVLAVGNERGTQSAPPDALGDCVDLTKAPASFADIRAGIAGKFELAIPESGLAGVVLRGTKGTCADKTRLYEANFYGGAAYLEDSESLSIPVVPNISCNTRTTYVVAPIDMLALDRTKSCAMAIPAAQGIVFAGNIRPQLLGDGFDRMIWEDGSSASSTNPAGKATVDSWTGATGPKSCIAIGYDGAGLAGSCVNPTTAALCASPGEVELAMIDPIYAGASIETALVQQWGQPVFGAVYRQSPAATVTKVPIASAIVELEDPAQGTVVYVAPGASKLMPLAGATGTDPSGMFIVYIKGDATTVLVKSGGTQQRYTIASQGDLPPTLLAVLP
jgi:hypothetical protein